MRDSDVATFDDFLRSRHWKALENEVYSQLSDYWDKDVNPVRLTIRRFKHFTCKCVKPPVCADCVDPIVDKLQCTCEALERYVHEKFCSNEEEEVSQI